MTDEIMLGRFGLNCRVVLSLRETGARQDGFGSGFGPVYVGYMGYDFNGLPVRCGQSHLLIDFLIF